MMKTEKQIEKDVYSLIKSSVSGLISGNVYRKGMRPDDARGEDIVVSFLTGLNQQVQSGIVNVNAYVPNINAAGYSTKVQNIKRIDSIEELVCDAIENCADNEYVFSIEDTPVADSVDGIDEHFVNFRVKYKRITIND